MWRAEGIPCDSMRGILCHSMRLTGVECTAETAQLRLPLVLSRTPIDMQFIHLYPLLIVCASWCVCHTRPCLRYAFMHLVDVFGEYVLSMYVVYVLRLCEVTCV